MSIFSKIAGLALPSPISWLITGLGWAGDLIARLAKWVFAHPAQALCLALAGLAYWQYSGRLAAEAESAVNLQSYQDEKRAHLGTVEGYFIARKVAAELDRQNAARAQAEFDQKLLEIMNVNTNLQRDNRDLIFERMRQPERSASIDSGSGGKTVLPVLSEMPSGALPGTGAAIISEADALICADNFSQLTGLIAAWQAASAIDVNGESE